MFQKESDIFQAPSYYLHSRGKTKKNIYIIILIYIEVNICHFSSTYMVLCTSIIA